MTHIQVKAQPKNKRTCWRSTSMEIHKDIAQSPETNSSPNLSKAKEKISRWLADRGFNNQRQQMHKIAINSYLLCFSYKACDPASFVCRHLLIWLLVSCRF